MGVKNGLTQGVSKIGSTLLRTGLIWVAVVLITCPIPSESRGCYFFHLVLNASGYTAPEFSGVVAQLAEVDVSVAWF